jgi:hypothetical protein
MGSIPEKNKLTSFPLRKIAGALGGVLVLATVFAVEPSLKNGLVMGPVCWFHRAVFILTVIVLLCEVFSKILLRTSMTSVYPANIHITLPDMLLLAFGSITLLTYDWSLHPEPEKLLFGGQLIVLWFKLCGNIP